MYLRRIRIKNFRLLQDVAIDLQQDTTVIVGKNNSGKTSFMDLLSLIVNNQKPSFYDYPINKRQDLYKNVDSFLKGEIEFDALLSGFALPSLELYVDYSLEQEDENLGYLSPFIIDTDEEITEVRINAEFTSIVTSEKMKQLFEPVDVENNGGMASIKEKLMDNFSDIVKLNIFALNPRDETKKRKMELQDFKNLFPLYKIAAERGLDESEQKNENPLRSLMSAIFKPNLDDSLKDVEDKITELKKLCKDVKRDSQIKINKLLNEIAHNSLGFGYPAEEDLKLRAEANIEFDKQIQSSVNLLYENDMTAGETLPNNCNGLGYKNLIKIELQLLDFANNIKTQIENSIPLVFIEEPESHMHPQMQQRFIEYIDSFCGNISCKNIQKIITTHSSHIVNSLDFEKIRYIKKLNNSISIKNFNDFCAVENNERDFVKKYLTLNRCDLFFADKAILIEGTAERLLIPDMIDKLARNEKFLSGTPTLQSQYYTLIEVGGAYAYRFIPFIRFLDIPTLIITDIDSVDENSKACLVSEGKHTSNATIKHWIKSILDSKDTSFSKIQSLSDVEKTSENLHIAYQVEENGLCGRSLEEAIKNVNRTIYKINDNAQESDLQYNAHTDGSKTDFALDLLFKESKKNYSIPKYIADGLIWLDKQSNGR